MAERLLACVAATGTGRRLLRLALLVALLLAAPVPPGAAQDPADAGWVIVVQEGEVFPRPGDNATLLGPGRLEVHGALSLEGAPGAPALLTGVSIVLHGEGPHRLAHARLAGPADVLVDLRGGALRVEDATFEGGGAALRAQGAARLEVVGATFLDQLVAGVLLRDNASAALQRVAFHGGAPSVRASGDGALDVRDAAFRGRATHVAVDAAPGWSGSVRNASFGPAAEGVVVRAAGPARLALEDTRFRGLGTGLVAEGASLVVTGTSDAFLANHVAVRSADAAVTLRRAYFANNTQDLDGPVTLDAPTFLRDAAPAAQETAARAPGAEALAAAGAFDARLALGAAILAFLAFGFLAYALRDRLRRLLARARARLLPEPLRDEARARIAETLEGAPPLHADDVARRAGVGHELAEALLDEMADEGSVAVGSLAGPDGAARYRLKTAPVPAGAPAPDLAEPLSPQEARILQDAADHPGTAQSAIAQRLGMSRQAIHYHVKKLETRGLVTKISKGRETRCYVRAEALALLPEPRRVPLAPREDAPGRDATPEPPATGASQGSGDELDGQRA